MHTESTALQSTLIGNEFDDRGIVDLCSRPLTSRDKKKSS